MIAGVAVRFKNGQEIRLPRPNRHCNCFLLAIEKWGREQAGTDGANKQGFYTDTGEYLNRKEAMAHVRAINQPLLPDPRDGEYNESDYLCSEDVW